MATIHLHYNTLKTVLDSIQYIDYPLIFTKKDTRINDVLRNTKLFPTVIEDIIIEYTYEIIQLKIKRLKINDGPSMHFKIYNEDINVNLDIYRSGLCFHFRIHIVVCTHSSIINQDEYAESHCTFLMNVFMKKVYNKNKYLDDYIKIGNSKCGYCDGDDYICPDNTTRLVMIKNKIMYRSDESDYVIITNAKKFTYLIVLLRCVLNGIQKYYTKN